MTEVASDSARAGIRAFGGTWRLPGQVGLVGKIASAGRARAADVSAICALLACLSIVQWPAMSGVGVYGRSDTLTFFYPVFATLHRSLREGSLPLWTPYIFGGFPLFAEGQMGVLYPPGVVAALVPDPKIGFATLRVFHGAVALLGTFWLLRVLQVRPLGACVGGLVFGLGSFAVGQQHHGSLLAAAVWLPLVLALAELGLRRADWATDGLLVLAGLCLAMAALASHPQPVLVGGGMLVSYVVARQGLACARAFRGARGSTAGRLLAAMAPALLGLWALILVPGIAAGAAAIQLVPQFELSQESWRAHAWSYRDAVEYSFPPFNLVTLLFPYFFRTVDGAQWSLWQSWEVVVYVGVVPLFLAIVGLVTARRWLAVYFGLVTALAGALSLGGYLPFELYEAIWAIPGVQLQRAPARLTLVVTFGLAILAAFGAQWLESLPSRRARRTRRRGLLLLAIGALLATAALLVHLVAWRSWLEAYPRWALEAIARWYLGSLRDPGLALSPLAVYQALDWSLNLSNPKTWLPLVLMASFALLLIVWRERPSLRRVWLAGLMGLVIVDLVIFSADFHPVLRLEDLDAPSAPEAFLASQSGTGRTLAERQVQSVRPNRLLTFQIADAAGYSPLELDRYRWYADAVATVPNALLDIWGVRFLVTSAEAGSLPSYQQVAYHPMRPLLIGGAGSPNGAAAFRVQEEPATEIRTIAALVDGAEIPDGDLVAEWVLTDDRGVRRIVPLRAGLELADWTIADPGHRTAHPPVQIAGTIPIRDHRSGTDVPRALSFAAQSVHGRHTITRVEYRHVHRLGRSILYGFGLYDGSTERVSQFFEPEKLVAVYRDEDTVIYENTQAFPRAWVVPEAVLAEPGQVLSVLEYGAFDPRRQVLLERTPDGPSPSELSPASGNVSAWTGSAEVVVDRGEELVVRAAGDGGFLVVGDAYYPGWRALVDGGEAKLYRANYQFRAVPLPPGDHEVRLLFDPRSFRIGRFVTLATLIIAAGLGALSLRGRWLGRGAVRTSPARARSGPGRQRRRA